MISINEPTRANETEAGRGLEGYLSCQQRLALAVA
jgi:hypothetical protein